MTNQKPHFAARQVNWKIQTTVIALLVGFGIASRLLLVDWPNFKPVIAIAIFCGFLCSSRWAVLMAVAAMMLVSDALIGFYSWPSMISVYGSMFLAGWAGSFLPQFLSRSNSIVAKLSGIAGTSIAASTVFYLLTNTECWLSGMYPTGPAGLLQSLAAGIPFFRFALAGNLLFTLLLFSGWFAIAALAGEKQPKAVSVAAAAERKTA